MSKLGVLEELAEQHEGYSKGAKYLLELKRKGEISGDVVGALADLVEVEPGYEMALEAALDSLAQAIVCDNFDSAVRISKTLNQQGRAILFYPSSNTVSDEKVPAPANLKRLIDFTRSGSSISKTYQELIRKYYIVDSLADAFELSAQFKDFVFVTKSGEICRNNIVIAGKLEAGEAGHLFGRESRIQMLKARIAELKIELGELKNTESDAVSRIESLQSSLKAAAEEIPALQVAHADAANQKAASERRLSEISESKSEKIRVSNALKEKADNLDAELSSIGSGLTDYTENLRVLQSKTQELKASKENCLIEREEILVKITTLKSNQQTVVQRAAQIEREMQSLKASLSEAERFVEAKETELTASEKRVVDTSAQIEELSDRLNQLQADKDSMSSRFDEIMTDKNAKTERLNEIEQQKNQNQQMSVELQTQLHELQLKLQNVGHEMKLVAEKISNTYSIQLSEAKEYIDSNPSDVQVEQMDQGEIEAIRERIAKSGGVNLIAVEEYEELKKRYEFLEKERQDLITAKEDIHKALQKINKQTREMFLTTFEQIQTYFVEYYKLLFGGGNAEIILLDRNDVLESGIEIVARPPGKKLQSISLLSGGEKALTAIALMFSVFRVKPSPFCVLDEIDAPLDDTNVGRFSTVLQEFIRESQFIIITHNKVTMEVSDAMYGVTMQKTGISRVVSVRFDDTQKTADQSTGTDAVEVVEEASPTIEI